MRAARWLGPRKRLERAGGEAEPGGAHCWRLLRRRVFVAALLTGGPVRLPSLRHALPASRHRCALAALGLDPGALGAPWPLSTGQGPGPQAGSLSLRLTLRARSHWRSRWIGGHLGEWNTEGPSMVGRVPAPGGAREGTGGRPKAVRCPPGSQRWAWTGSRERWGASPGGGGSRVAGAPVGAGLGLLLGP